MQTRAANAIGGVNLSSIGNANLTVLTKKLLGLGMAPAALLACSPAHAQESPPELSPPSLTTQVPVILPEKATPTAAPDDVDFSADALNYDSEADIVTAEGNVHMTRDGNRLRADKIVWNRKTGEISASGTVAVVNPGGDTAYGDSVVLTDSLKDGIVENLLLVLADGGRLVARHGERRNGVTTLTNAAYTPCHVTDEDGCPREPAWKLTAVRVIHDPVKHRIYYKGARLSVFGMPLIWLPGLSHPDGSDQARTGFLVPDIRYTRTNGIEATANYYMALAPNRDLTLTPHVYEKVLPAIEAHYRALSSHGAYAIGGMITASSRLPETTGGPVLTTGRDIRGYIDAHGTFQLDRWWTLSGSLLAASDKTFLRRYDISDSDRLRSTLQLERIGQQSYFSIAGWATQTLRIGDPQNQQPIALPAIDYRRRIADPLFGGRIELQANSLSLIRTAGQDTERAFASLRWDLRRRTALGQEIQLTLYGRGDVYHTDETLSTATVSYRGSEGWSTRAIGAAAIDMRWPFVGPLFGGSQRITPRVQLVASPATSNMDIPNEDARSVDLEDSNLFALNRFPGYDRWEDGSRITYGFEWAFDLPTFSIESIIGQSYRLSRQASILPNGTGLSDHLSDIVGRTTIRWRDFIALTHRYRIDKDNGSIRRNEINATVGSRKTYVTVGYLRLNRDIDTAIEDLRDREEIQLAGRIQIARYWSLFGSTVIDLTDQHEDPTSQADGYDPVRHRIELLYEDDCFQLGLSWRHDYELTGDARRGDSFRIRLAFKNLGR